MRRISRELMEGLGELDLDLDEQFGSIEEPPRRRRASDVLAEELGIIDETRYPIGTKRKRKDGEYIKVGPAKWEKATAGSEQKAKKNAYREKLSDTMAELNDAVANGKLRSGMSVGQHVKIGKDLQKGHEAGMERLKSSLQALAPGAKIKARTKKLESILGKLVRKPKYGDARALQDVTGSRVIHKSIAEVKNTVNAIKAKYKVVTEDDYISSDKDGYRSHHLIIEDEDGFQKEVQVRTENQNVYADWAHDIYKPPSKELARKIFKGKDEIESYSKAMSEHFFRVDSGEKSEKPSCPESVRDSLGCL